MYPQALAQLQQVELLLQQSTVAWARILSATFLPGARECP